MSRRSLIPGKSILCAIILPLLLFLLPSCAGKKKTVRANRGRPRTEIHIDTHGLSKNRREIVEEAMTWLGTPYEYAGEKKGRGCDCSGMVMRVYMDVLGRKLPRNSAKQAEYCKRIKTVDVRPGDLVFFATGKDPDRISHVGIMLDEVNFIHASTSKGVVISQVNTPYYTRTFKMYGRVPDFNSK